MSQSDKPPVEGIEAAAEVAMSEFGDPTEMLTPLIEEDEPPTEPSKYSVVGCKNGDLYRVRASCGCELDYQLGVHAPYGLMIVGPIDTCEQPDCVLELYESRKFLEDYLRL